MPNTVAQRIKNEKIREEKRAELLRSIASGLTLHEALYLLDTNDDTLKKWREEHEIFNQEIIKYFQKKNQEPFAARYCQLLKDEFAWGGSNRSFAVKFDLPLAKVLAWQQTETGFAAAHEEAIRHNVPVICQQLLDHMAAGLSIRTFPSAIGEYPATVKLWYLELPLLKQTRQLAKLGLIRTLEETGQRALAGDKFPAATYGLIMKNLADWRDMNKNEAKELPRPQVVVVLPEQRRQISEADIIEIKPREMKPLDFADVG